MAFESLPDFLAMGGHALYVWLAYGAFALVLAVNLLAARRLKSRALREIRFQARVDRKETCD
ncbi:MAG: heme exporter protein CcmD [Pseudomonadota bacterium]